MKIKKTIAIPEKKCYNIKAFVTARFFRARVNAGAMPALNRYSAASEPESTAR